ncbi:MAG: glycerophosphodiester phosphodiesterase family protein [bacterium]
MHTYYRHALLITLLTLTGCAATTGKNLVDPTDRALILSADLPFGPLKRQLQSCAENLFYRTEFSISHRGAPLGYPEHTREGYEAAAAMGAGVIECDVTFTKDLALVCRHSQCDLHRTTNILETEHANSCSEGFKPAATDASGKLIPATARCCTSDITLSQYRDLCGRRDIVNERADSVAQYLTAPVTDLVEAPVACGTLVTHDESIRLFDALGVAFTPELKSPMVNMPYAGMSQENYATRLIEAYEAAGIGPDRVYPQSFNINDVLFWIAERPAFGQQAVYLDPRGRDPDFVPSLEDMQRLKAAGINIIAPPMPMLLIVDENDELVASPYAEYAQQAGLDIITWTFESGEAHNPDNWLYANLPGYLQREGQSLEVLHALAEKVGIRGIFSDWPGTVTYYANCMDLVTPDN